MTAEARRISRRSDFTRTLTTGVRVSARDLLMHIAPIGAQWPDPRGTRGDVALIGGPWLGLIVSKKVGNSVIRHRVARRLRHAFAEVRTEFPHQETLVVVRAHPSIADRSSDELADQMRSALDHAKARRAFARVDA